MNRLAWAMMVAVIAAACGENSDEGGPERTKACAPTDLAACQAGQGCYFTDSARTEGVCQAAGSKVAEASCAADAECLPGAYCADLEGRAPTCAPICGPETPCPLERFCVRHGEDYGFCALRCDLLDFDACGEGNGCFLDSAGDPSRAQCFPAGMKKAGEPCLRGVDCGSGMACAGVGGQPSQCLDFCDVEDADPGCPETHKCVGLAKGDPVGVCIPK